MIMPEPRRVAESSNIDPETVAGFGAEWSSYDQLALSDEEYRRLFDRYFGIFPFDRLPAEAEGFDLGCGSGRWASGVVGQVGRLHCIDPSPEALAVARRRLGGSPNADFHLAAADSIPLADASQDFGYSLGVLHHIPDTKRALADCVRKLKPGGWFLVYLYYRFDHRPGWYRALWSASDLGRRAISRLPFFLRKTITSLIAGTVYWPLARTALLAERAGADVANFPLSAYRRTSFYSMRTDALDRFGTRLEHRFSRDEIRQMMEAAGLTDIQFSEREPYWVACGRKAPSVTKRTTSAKRAATTSAE
jgi:ubiquinone/menaquinone biosynthesis C-methylase UbiE